MNRFSIILILILAFSLFSFTISNINKNDDKKFIVVLDAGHGGHDPGCLGNGYFEKKIALNIVLSVGKILEKYPNIKVVYTRNEDVFVDLFTRGEIANKANADLFVSVHCDSHNSDAHGAGTFVLGLHANEQNFEIAKKENSVIYLEDDYETRYSDYDINSPESVIGLTIMQEEFLDQSIALAKAIQDNFSNELKRKDRKVKQAGFIVLHQTFMPSVLIETGFLSNDDEGAYLNSRKGQSEMGSAIANAILKYKKEIEAKVNTSSNSVSIASPNPEELEYVASVEEAIVEPTVVVTKETKLTKDQSLKEISEEVKNNVIEEADLSENKKEALVENPKTETKEEVSKVIFKVQLMASKKKRPLTPEQFNGLNILSEEKYESYNRYMYGKVNTYEEAKLLKTNADKKGYPTSYIVAYKDGVRITIKQAIKYASEY